jgi:protein SCO1
MFFATCEYACPILLHDMKRIEAALPEELRDEVGFVLITFDAERDTVEALHAYRGRQELSTRNWTLLRGEPEDVRELAALLGISYRRDARGQFAHSNIITLLDREGEIVRQLPGLNQAPDTAVAVLKTLLKN